jgi:hypothetical protein
MGSFWRNAEEVENQNLALHCLPPKIGKSTSKHLKKKKRNIPTHFEMAVS